MGIEIEELPNPKRPMPFENLFNPRGRAPVFYYIYILTHNRKKLLWYTRYDDASFDIARTLSTLLSVPIHDPGGLLAAPAESPTEGNDAT